MRGDDVLAEIAAQFGYADQAHLIGDFRAAPDLTPGAYRRALQEVAGAWEASSVR